MGETVGLDGGDAVPEILDLHSTLPTQVGVVGSREEIIDPKTTLDTSGVIHFEIASSHNEMIDAYNTMILIESKIVNADGTDIPAINPLPAGGPNPNNKVIAVNGLSHAWMKGCEVKLNGTQIAPNDGNYATRADLDIRLGYPKETKEGSLEICGFNEEHTAFDNIADGDMGWEDPPASAHPQLMKRWLRGQNSKTIYTMGHIHSEIFEQPKPLPPGTRLSLYFTKQHKNELLYMTKLALDFKVVMLRCRLLTRIITVDPDILTEMNHVSYLGRPMQYPIRRVEITVATKQQNVTDFSETSILKEGNILPRRLFIGFVRQPAFFGDRSYDPFNYAECNIRQACLRLGGQILPYAEINCNAENGNVLEPLTCLLKATGTLFTDQDLGINLSNFARRNFILGYDLTHSQMAAGQSYELPEVKSSGLSVSLFRSHTYAHTMVVYAEYDAELEIDSVGNVKKKDFAV